MEPVNNAHNPWLEQLGDAQPGTAAKVTGIALSVMAMALFGPVILIYKACIRLQRDAPDIESINIEIGVDDDDDVDNSGIGIYNPYRNDLVNWFED